MSRRNLLWTLALPGLVATCLYLTAKTPPPSEDYQLVRTLVDVLVEVDKNYVRKLTPQQKRKLIEDMINGGLERLDPYSEYFNADMYKAFETQTEGQFGGVGILLKRDTKSRFLQVGSPVPGTPAYQAGVQTDDFILKIGDTSTEDMRIEEAQKLIKGEPGTAVRMTFLRDATAGPVERTLTRAVIELHAVGGARRDPSDPGKWDYLVDREKGVGLVRLIHFSEKTERELTAAVAEARKQGAKSLILDLRENPGGLLTQAVKVSDLFLASGPIVGTESQDRATNRKWEASAGDAALEDPARLPLAVLVNGGTASASEIVAAALQDNKRAVVVGERSYGKGSVQRVYPLEGGAAVKLTGEQWLRANGGSIHRWPDSKPTDEWGVRPDAGLEVVLSPEQRAAYFDHLRGLDVIPGKGAKPLAAFADPVVAKAVERLGR